MKKDKYYAIAENMYVEKFITVAEIARRIGVHERTIKRWKKYGDWSCKRKDFIEHFSLSKEDTFMQAKYMLQSFNVDLQNNNNIEPSRIYKFTNLLESVVRKEKEPMNIESFIRTIEKRTNIDKDIIDKIVDNLTDSD